MANADHRIRVLCVDDHNLVLDGLRLIITREPDLDVVGLAANGREALKLFQQQRPDITLLDLQMPVMTGLQAIQAIRLEDASAKIIVLTTYRGDEDIFRALQAGAKAYLLKDTLSNDLIRVIRAVHVGTYAQSAEVGATLAKRAARPTLTTREIEVTQLLSKGLRNRQIATLLGIGEETVQAHVKHILEKLEVQDRTAAVNVALRRGIIHLAE